MRNVAANVYADKTALANAVASTIKDIVLQSANGNPTVIALAGGETPKPVYRILAKQKLPWHRLQFVATDERISNDSKRSNQKMLRAILGAQAQVCELCQNAPAPKVQLALLGMGADGHIASLFADAMPNKNETHICKVAPAAANEERLTLPLSVFVNAPRLLLMITGEEKLEVLNSHSTLPISKLLTNRRTTTEVFYAPD